MRTRLLVAFCLLTLVLPAAAGIEKFIDDRTAMAGEVDLTKVDPDAIGKWVSETFKTAQLLGPTGPGPTETELAKAMGEMKKWLTDAKAQGATVAYVVAGDEQTRYMPFVAILPVPDDKAKAMAGLLYSGSATGPSKPEQRGANPQDFGGRPIAEEVPGVGAMLGVAERIKVIRATQPKARPDIEAAFKAAGTAPAKVVVAPTAKLQGNMRGAPVPLLTFLGNTKWAVGTVDVPPKPGVKVTLQAKDAEAAKQLHQMIVMYAGLGVASGAGLTPEFTKLLTPTLQGDQVVVALDEKHLVTLAGELKGPMLLAKQQAQRVASMSNIRQLLMACIMYKTENKNTWPADLKAVAKYVRGKNDVMTNPAHPEITPAYVYFKPTEPIVEPGKLVVLHEAHTEFRQGVNVGFADGHVEFVVSKARFDELIAATAQAAQQ